MAIRIIEKNNAGKEDKLQSGEWSCNFEKGNQQRPHYQVIAEQRSEAGEGASLVAT